MTQLGYNPEIPSEHRRRASRASSLRGGGIGHESEGESSEEDDFDDISYGTMARFVPTLVLERLRNVGEAAMANKQSSLSESEGKGSAGRVEGANVPKVWVIVESRRWHVLLFVVIVMFGKLMSWKHFGPALAKRGRYISHVLSAEAECVSHSWDSP